MDYRRVRYAQSPLRPMGSPDGLGAYFQTTYTKPISPAGGGASTIAAYTPISGLGACPCAASGVGDLSDEPEHGASAAPAAPSLLSSVWAKLALGAGALFLASKLWGKKTHKANRRHRRNGRRRRRH